MATLRNSIGIATDSGLAARLADQDVANGMGSLRRGWESGRIGNELNPLRTEALDAELAGNLPLAQSLRGQIDNLQQRQRAYTPAVGRVEDIHGVGDGLDWAAGQVGQGAASMADPMAVSAGLGAAGRVVGAIPHPLARAGSLALQGGALGVPALMSKRQLTGEFIGEAERDPALMARTSPQSLRDMAGNYGTLAAIPDSVLPGIVGRQISGLSRAGSQAARKATLSAGTKTLLEMAGEGGTEALQSAGSQYARGRLNPERDTSGDFMENVNSFAGGAVGAGPFAAAGSFGEAAHNRVDSGVDAAKDATGNVVDLMGGSAPVQAGKRAFGAAKDGVIDLMAGDNAKDAAGALVDKLKAATVDLGSRASGALNERNILNEIPPDDIAADDAKLVDWLGQNRAARHQLVIDKLSAMPEDDAEAQQHLAAAAAQYPDAEAQDQAVSAAARFVLDRTPLGRAEERANSLGENLGKIAGVVGPALGKGAVAAGKAALGFGKSVLSGAQDGLRKKNAQAEAEQESFSTWRDRVYGVRGQQAADEALANADPVATQRADLAGNYVADMAGRLNKKQPNMALLARRAAFTLADTVMRVNAKGIGQKSVQLNRLVDDLYGTFRAETPEVLAQLGAIMGPKAAPVFEYLTNEVAARGTPGAARAQAAARDALATQTVALVDPAAQNKLLAQGINLNTPSGREQLLGIMEDFADGIGSGPGLRKALEDTFGADSVKGILELLNGQQDEQPVDTMQSEPISEFEQRVGEKLLAKNTGPKVFGFHATVNPRSSLDGRDMFAPTEKSKPGDTSVPKRPSLFKKGQQLFGGKGDAIEKKIADIKQQLSEDPAYPDHDNYRVEARSAHDVMKDAGMQPGKMLQLYRDYMHAEYNDEKNPPEQKRYFAQQMRVANNMIKDGLDPKSKLTTPRERKETTAAAEQYFKERFVVVGEQLSNQDPSKITLSEVLAMHKAGQGLIERSRLAEDRAAALSDANVLMFKSDAVKGGELAIPAGKLVKWVKEARGKSTVDSAEDTGGSFSNKSKDEAYLADVMEGIAALIGSGRVKGMPYKVNEAGKAENFSQGVPDSLRLATKTYGAMKFADQKRQESQTPKTAEELAPSAATQEKVAAEQTVAKSDETEGSIDDAHPEVGKAKTEETDKTPLDFQDKQAPGEVADEFAAQRWLSRQTGASTDAVPGPESKGTAVSSADYRAEAITAAFLNDPAKGQEMIRSRIRMALAPEYTTNKPEYGKLTVPGVAGKDQLVGGVHYIAPVAAFVSAKNLAAHELDLPAKTIQAIQAKVANILLKGQVSDTERIKITRLLVAGTDEKISAFNVKPVLQRIADGVAVQGKPVVAKQEAAPEVAKAGLPKGQPTPSGERNAQDARTAGSKASTQAERDAATAYATKVLGPKITVAFKDITGYSGEFIDAQNAIEISTTAAAGTLGTLYHEAMHVFFRDFVKGNPRVRVVFESLINDPKHLAKLHALLDGYPAARAQLVSGEERLAYTYQFWKAGLLEVDAKAHTWLQKLGKFFRRVAGMVRDSERALELFQAFDNGKMSEPSAAGKVIAQAMERGTQGLKMRRKMDALFQGLAALTFPSAEILGRSVSPTARKLGTMFFTNPGEEAHGKEQIGLMNARRSVAQQYINTSNRRFETMSEADQAAVQKYLQSEAELADIPYGEHRAAVKDVRDLLDRFHQYMTESGMKIGKIDKYYPTVWSTQALLGKKQAFTDMLVSKYAKELAPLNGNVQEAAERVWQSLVNKEGVDAHLPTNRDDGVLTPFFASQEMRTLPWLKGEDKEAYLEKDMPLTLTRYFSQGAHATEYFRRFGENGKRLGQMLVGIGAELTVASGEMVRRGELADEKARVEWVGRQMRDVTQATGAMEGSLGKDVSPNMRKFNSWMAVYQNIRLLPMALFSSFVDPLSMVARGAPLQAAYETFVYGMREVFRGWADVFKDMPPQRQKDEWRKLAEAIGASEIAMFSNLVSDQYSSTYMTPGAKRINDKMFVFNGMEAWNRGNRIMATKWAVRFIEQHAALPDRHHSARWLTELGLTPAMITKDAQGNLITDRHELAAAKGISLDEATKEIAHIHNAINRWVEGAVLTPNAAQRPSWSSDPSYASMFHLKQFSYSFHQTILKRATNEFKHGNMAPLGALALFVPTMIGADIMKGLIQGAGTLPPYMAGMNAGDWVVHGVQRAGLSGIGVIGMDAATDWASLGGPAFEQIVDAARDGFGSSTALKAAPLHAVYGELVR